jgi:hypothetical protein
VPITSVSFEGFNPKNSELPLRLQASQVVELDGRYEDIW